MKVTIEDRSYPYRMGYDCEENGANFKNSHFSIFLSLKSTEEWERGNRDAKSDD